MKMLCHETRLILDRHFIACKRHHFGTEFQIKSMQWCLVKRIAHAGSSRHNRDMKKRTHPSQENAAPSVLLPEIAIPSAGATAPLSRIYRSTRSFGLRVSGAVAPSALAQGQSLPCRSLFILPASSKLRNRYDRLCVTCFIANTRGNVHGRTTHGYRRV